MENLKVKLLAISENGSQRFYKLSHGITKGMSGLGSPVDIEKELIGYKDQLKDEYKHLCPENPIDLVCISDAHSHVERLVFVAMEMPGEYARTRIPIGGQMTFKIHGGDPNSIREDYVYFGMLAKLNGLEFHYCDFDKTLDDGK